MRNTLDYMTYFPVHQYHVEWDYIDAERIVTYHINSLEDIFGKF